MKIFYTASLQGKKDFGKHYKTLYEEIAKLGYEHTDNAVINLQHEDYISDLKSDREARLESYRSALTNMKKADLTCFEISSHDLDIGFLVNKALEMGKPTIALFLENNIPFLLSGVEDEKLIIREYTEKNIKKILYGALDIARERRDKRFNFFISPKLLEYLEKASKIEGVTKSKFIRNLITEHMRNSNVEVEE